MSQSQTQTRILKLYSPHMAQLRFHTSPARYRVSAWGRQSGKSSGALNDAIGYAWRTPNTTTWFCSPTYDQARVQYRRLIGMLWKCTDVFLSKNKTELRIKLVNQSQIRFVSGESLDNLRGETLHNAYVDEVRDHSPDLWPLVIRPMLATTKGRCAFLGTPNGYDHFYDMADTARSDSSGTWEFMHAPSICNPLFTTEEFERLRLEMSEPQFAQEILAEFRDLTSGKAYIGFTQSNVRPDNPFAHHGHPLSAHLPIVIGLDFNVSPMSWALGQHRNGQYYWFDEISLKNTNTQEAAKVLIERVNGHATGVILCGDATGQSRSTKSTETDYAIICNALRAANIKWENRTPSSNPPVKERVNLVNAKLRDAQGVINMWINPRCVNLKRDFERVVWKDSQSNAILDQSGSNKDLTHMSDAVGYVVAALSPIDLTGSVGKLKVIIR